MMNSRCTSSPSLSSGLAGSITGRGNGWRGGTDRTTADLSGVGASVKVVGVMMGLRMYSFINVMVDCLTAFSASHLAVRRFNPSWHLTPGSGYCSAARFTRVGPAAAVLFNL